MMAPAGRPTATLWEAQGYPQAPLCEACSLPVPQLMPGPRYVTLLVTWRCNSRCTICGVARRGGDGAGQELSTEELLRVVAELDAAGTTDVILSGGEPLVRPDIYEIMEDVNRRDIAASCALCTNGTLIDRVAAKRIARAGVKVRVVVSLDGPDAATHDAVRGVPGSFAAVTAGIRNLVEAFGSGEHIGVNTIVNRRNADSLRDTLELCAVLGAKTVKVAPVFPDSAAPHLRLGPDAMADLLAASSDIAAEGRARGLEVIDLVPFAAVSMSACFMPSLAMVIDPEGWIVPCNAAMGGFGGDDPTHRLGSVRGEAVAAVWRGAAFERFREGARRRRHRVCGARHCGDVTITAMNYIRGPCKSCQTGAPFAHPFAGPSAVARP
jgi:MoaA/NifB/PqqE/SkfB family radical SAM enzyme